MQAVMQVLCLFLWLGGGALFIMGTSAVLQIVGCIVGLSGTVMFVGAALVGAIEDQTRALKGKPE
jgi:hypothetical protein